MASFSSKSSLLSVFTTVVVDGHSQDVNDTVLKVVLKPGAEVKLTLGMKRYVNTPTYNMPPFER